MLRDVVLGGDFPSWNPFFSAGQPLAANPEHEVFYPLTWLILLPRFDLAFHLLIVLHLYIAAGAMYAFLRSLRLGPPAAFFGALSFVMGGLCLSYLNLLPYLFAVAWLPLTCLFARRFLLQRSWPDFAFASFFLGIQLLIGEPSTILQTGILLGIYAVRVGVRQGGVRAIASGVALVGLLSIAALLLAAVQMLPAMDHAAGSVRSRGFPFAAVTSWSLPPARLGELVHPNLLGHQMLNGQRVYWGGALYPDRGTPFLHSIYPGLLFTTLLVAGFIARVRGAGLAAIVLATSVLLASGAHTPLWQLLYDAGLVRSLRYPEKFMLMGIFAATGFAAIVLDRLLAGDPAVRKSVLVVVVVLTVATGILAALAVTPMHARVFIALWEPPARVLTRMLSASRSGWVLVAARGLLLLVLLRNLERVRRTTWLALLAVFVVLDLGMLLPELAPRVPSAYYREPPRLAQQLPADREPWRLFHIAGWQTGTAGWYFAPQPDLYWIHRNAMYPMMPSTWGIRTVIEPDYDRTALLPTTDFVDAVWSLSRRRDDWLPIAAGMANAWYGAVFVPPEDEFARVRGDRTILQPVRLLDLAHGPRYGFASRVETVYGKDDFVEKLAGKRFPPGTAFIAGPSFSPARGVVRAVSETANRARISVETAGRGFLVMSVTPQKYWRITIDGKDAQPVVTNIGFQGVVLPNAGRHVVEMRYRNPLVPIGGAVSLGALALLGALARRRS